MTFKERVIEKNKLIINTYLSCNSLKISKIPHDMKMQDAAILKRDMKHTLLMSKLFFDNLPEKIGQISYVKFDLGSIKCLAVAM